MPTNEQVLNEILNGELKNEIAPVWSPVTDNTDTLVAAILNRKDQSGYVAARDVIGYLAENLKWGMIEMGYLHLKMPDGITTCPPELFNMYADLHLASHSPLTPPFRLVMAPLATGISKLVDLKLLTQSDAIALTTMERKISRAEVVWGYDTIISVRQISDIRNGVN